MSALTRLDTRGMGARDATPLTCAAPRTWVNMTDSMTSGDGRAFEGEGSVSPQDDLRHRISTALLQHVDAITADAVALFPYTTAETLDVEYCGRVGQLLARLLAF